MELSGLQMHRLAEGWNYAMVHQLLFLSLVNMVVGRNCRQRFQRNRTSFGHRVWGVKGVGVLNLAFVVWRTGS